MMLKIKRHQRGIGLLELMLSLAIIAILLIMATRYFETAHRSQRVNESLELIQSIVSGSSNYLMANHNYTDIDTEYVVGYVPKFYVKSDNKSIINPWNTAVTVGSSDGKLQIAFGTMPLEACTMLKNVTASFADTATCTDGAFTILILEDAITKSE